MRLLPRLSRSFWQGFFSGLSGPALMARRLNVQRPARFSPSVSNSWARVGRVLEHTMNTHNGTTRDRASRTARNVG